MGTENFYHYRPLNYYHFDILIGHALIRHTVSAPNERVARAHLRQIMIKNIRNSVTEAKVTEQKCNEDDYGR